MLRAKIYKLKPPLDRWVLEVWILRTPGGWKLPYYESRESFNAIRALLPDARQIAQDALGRHKGLRTDFEASKAPTGLSSRPSSFNAVLPTELL